MTSKPPGPPGPTIRPQKPKRAKPVETAIGTWLATSSISRHICSGFPDAEALIVGSPKRWVVYEPMVLLPAGSFSSSLWRDIIAKVTDEQMHELWDLIIRQISNATGGKSELTHLAVNEGIPLHQSSPSQDSSSENILRSPNGLRILFGDFGPSTLVNGDGGEVTEQDFENAFWVSTKQNGIYQTWAPRWTMFSRGNVKEKTRLLRELKGRWAVDLYAGIGYFVFSYVTIGMRVFCWELNAWSVEGLRRGAVANGWSVRVIRPKSFAKSDTVDTDDLLSNGSGDTPQIIVFLEDNRLAQARLIQPPKQSNFLHINLGFLPSSNARWRDAFEVTLRASGERVWLHLHENVGVAEIENRKSEIQRLFDEWVRQTEEDTTKEKGKGRVQAVVEHVELVKTFAPGVWHCVFDVCVTRQSNANTFSIS
ncbi:tRNA wybutosine-synthesizing protein [Xylariales sp. AK1849]|nr:tRNA wybutosine-synthesizing protein [Xylariales sp. AK1849]